MNFDFSNFFDAVNGELARQQKEAAAAAKEFVETVVMPLAVANTPVGESGELRESAYVGEASVSGGGNVTVDFGFSSPHALFRHESPIVEDAAIGGTAGGTAGNKFLERATAETASQLDAFVGSRISK